MATVDSLTLVTTDGQRLDADIATPDTAAPVGAAAVCHPHPLSGGSRHDPVVDAMFRTLTRSGFVTIRFDFRADHGGGVDERHDVVAALDALAARTSAPLAVAGYSFGGVVAIGTPDPRIRAIAAVAPPLGPMEVAAPAAPSLVLSPRHDQFCPPDDAATATAGWEGCTRDAIESADHFLAGHAAGVAERVARWLTDQVTAI